MKTPTEVAQAQLDAYNAQVLDAHVAYFADDVKVADLNGAVTIEGIEAYRARYAKVFAEFPENKAVLVNRITIGSVASTTSESHEARPRPRSRSLRSTRFRKGRFGVSTS